MRTIPYGRHFLEEDDIESVVEVLRGAWLTQGPKVAEFEAGELLLCGHHWRAHRNTIVETAKSYYVEPEHEDFIIQKQKESINVAG